MHVRELLQCANGHVVTNVITTKHPGKQTQQSSAQLHRDHPTNHAQQGTNRNENKTTSLSLMKPYWIQFDNILVCVRFCNKFGFLSAGAFPVWELPQHLHRQTFRGQLSRGLL